MRENRNIKPGGVAGSRRHNLNISAYKNFLFESDLLDVETQTALIPKLAEILPIRLATFSGSKSVHLIVSVADTLPLTPHTNEAFLEYKRIWQGLARYLDQAIENIVAPTNLIKPRSGLKFLDPATCDPARLSRIPGATRENGVEQAVLYQGGYTTASQIYELLPKTRIPDNNVSAKTAPNPDLGLSQFERLLQTKLSLLPLRLKLESKTFWTAEAGLYGDLFKIAMWCIDATGVPYTTLNMYLQKQVYPTILRAGYPRDPDRAVKDAYVKKGLTVS
jgi:hypothetical protein